MSTPTLSTPPLSPIPELSQIASPTLTSIPSSVPSVDTIENLRRLTFDALHQNWQALRQTILNKGNKFEEALQKEEVPTRLQYLRITQVIMEKIEETTKQFDLPPQTETLKNSTPFFEHVAKKYGSLIDVNAISRLEGQIQGLFSQFVSKKTLPLYSFEEASFLIPFTDSTTLNQTIAAWQRGLDSNHAIDGLHFPPESDISSHTCNQQLTQEQLNQLIAAAKEQAETNAQKQSAVIYRRESMRILTIKVTPATSKPMGIPPTPKAKSTPQFDFPITQPSSPPDIIPPKQVEPGKGACCHQCCLCIAQIFCRIFCCRQNSYETTVAPEEIPV